MTDANSFPAAHSKWNDPLSANLVTMDGEQWRAIRTKLSPVFSAMSTRSVLSSLQVVGDDLMSYVDQFADNEETPLEIRDMFMRYISDAISSSILGVDTAALREDHHPLMNIGQRVFREHKPRDIYFFFLIVSYSKLLRSLRMRLLPADITEHFIKTMDEAIRVRVANNNDAAPRSDLLDLLVRIEQAGCLTDDETGEVRDKITHNQLLGHAFMVFVLGFITSRMALNYGLLELAQNPQIQDRLREEVLHTLPVGQEITYDNLESMVYLQQVVDGEREDEG